MCAARGIFVHYRFPHRNCADPTCYDASSLPDFVPLLHGKPAVNLPSLSEADGMVNNQGKHAPPWFHRMQLFPKINELTTPSKVALGVCGSYDTTATRGAGSGYAWCNAAIKDSVTDRKDEDKAIGLSFGAGLG